MSNLQHLYTGSAGQAAVMSEFLFRGYNVAVPEVDRGDDLFVVEDVTGSLSRIQVKAAIGKRRARSAVYTAQVKVAMKQLTTPQTPALTYVFVLRCEDRWRDFIVVAQSVLDDLRRNHGVGAVVGPALILRLSVGDGGVWCSKRDLSAHRNDFSRWQPIKH